MSSRYRSFAVFAVALVIFGAIALGRGAWRVVSGQSPGRESTAGRAAAGAPATTDSAADSECGRDTVMARPTDMVLPERLDAVRVGAQWRIPLTNGRVLVLYRCLVSGAWATGAGRIIARNREVRVIGTYPALNLLALSITQGESVQEYLVHGAEGVPYELYGSPQLSPDGSLELDWRGAVANGHVRPAVLTVYRVDRDALRGELSIGEEDPGDSGPEAPVWVDSRTIEFWCVRWRGRARADSIRIRMVRDTVERTWRFAAASDDTAGAAARCD